MTTPTDTSPLWDAYRRSVHPPASDGGAVPSPAHGAPVHSPAELAELVEGVPAEEYHRRELGVVSSSALKWLLRSPAHYHAWVNGYVSTEETPAMVFGRALHAAILEPEVFAQGWAVEPDFGDCRRKDNKAARDEWRQANEGKVHISERHYRQIERMREALLAHPWGRRFLEVQGRCELTARWRDPETKLACKARADKFVVKGGKRTVIDLKSAQDAGPDGFGKAAARYAYHVQAAHYREGFGADHFILMVVEKLPPYAVCVYELDDEAMGVGQELRAGAMNRLARCLEAGEWPAYGAGIRELSLPGRAVS